MNVQRTRGEKKYQQYKILSRLHSLLILCQKLSFTKSLSVAISKTNKKIFLEVK